MDRGDPLSRRRWLTLASGLALTLAPLASAAQTGATLDHDYGDWDALLKRHVHWLADGHQSRVDYRGFAAEHAALDQVLAQWSAVPASAFTAFSRAQ